MELGHSETVVGRRSEMVEARSGREVGRFGIEEVHSGTEAALRFGMTVDRSGTGVKSLVHQVAGIVEEARMPRYFGTAVDLGG